MQHVVMPVHVLEILQAAQKGSLGCTSGTFRTACLAHVGQHSGCATSSHHQLFADVAHAAGLGHDHHGGVVGLGDLNRRVGG